VKLLKYAAAVLAGILTFSGCQTSGPSSETLPESSLVSQNSEVQPVPEVSLPEETAVGTIHLGEIEGQFLLETELEPILVNVTPDMLEGIEADMTVTVYSNGAMTMSLPAQIGAEFITVTETIID